ncbi:MAG: hypothetical protein LBJ67_06110 [Planctomycetaceae bacterium]|jgi:hypothetical protein|nr:hypothetical protein [Planctomycetaceae bacterium]
MKKCLTVFFGSLTLGFGLLALSSGTVGSLVSKNETRAIIGGTCYNTTSIVRTVCSNADDGCTSSTVNGYTAVNDGANKLIEVLCGTSQKCKYKNVATGSGAGCSGG